MKDNMSLVFELQNIHSSIDGKEIVRGVSLQVNEGETHAIMGPNGSGKSTLASTLAGHPFYEQTAGKILLQGEDITELSPDERAQKGVFLAFQYPVEVPGVSVQNFLRQAYQARFVGQPDRLFKKVIDFRKHLQSIADSLDIDQAFLARGLNEGFSGGEKKQLEILQMAVLEPVVAILDETDSGLDIDAIKKVSNGVKKIQKQFNTALVVITHYRRILDYLKPDKVHVMVQGKIVTSGDETLVDELEERGYKELTQ